MGHRSLAVFLFLVLFLFPAVAPAANDGSPPAGKGADASRPEDPPEGLDRDHFYRTSLCPYIANTPQFRSGGLGYVHSVDFAMSVYAVANGDSDYSPEVIPSEWMAVAYSWWTHVAVDEVARIDLSGGSGIVRPAGEADSADARVDRVGLLSPTGGVIDLERNGLTGESCSPMLLFRASLDYRRRAKHPEAKLVFPYQVRNATKHLDDSIRAKLAMARTFVEHAEVVSGKIAVASRLGAERCQPKEIARARDDLDRARRSVADLHLAVDDTEESFARAESSADRILGMQRFAASRGLLCYNR